MPDFTYETYYHCLSVEYFSMKVAGSKGKEYLVEMKRSEGDCEFDWHCECEGFKFRGKCKHIEAVKKSGKYCGWMQFTEGGEPAMANGEKVCPKCGGEIVGRRWAV